MNETHYPFSLLKEHPSGLVKTWMLKFKRDVDIEFNYKDVRLCADLISEEETETWNELTPFDEETGSIEENLEQHIDRAKLTKELADLIWVCYFCAHKFGLPIDAVFRRVYDSNMSKLADNGEPILREDGKILKSDNYVPPYLDDLF